MAQHSEGFGRCAHVPDRGQKASLSFAIRHRHMEPKRARRIRDKQRMKAKAIRVYAKRMLRGDEASRFAKLADHIKACSCHMCCNPRRSAFHSGEARLTMQERRHFASQHHDG